MNPLTQIKNTQKVSKWEVERGVKDSASWHARYSHSAYIFAGGLDFELTEGDLLAVFAQYGEIVDVNLVRNKETGKSRGFAFLAYEDQRSTVLAVDNLSGAKVANRKIRVEHVDDYKKKKKEMGVEDEDEPAGAKEVPGAEAERWAHDKHVQGARNMAPAGPGPSSLPEPPGRAPKQSSHDRPWEAPGSIFAIMAEAEALKSTPSSNAGGHTHQDHREKKRDKMKEKKKRKDRHDNARSHSPPSSPEGQNGERGGERDEDMRRFARRTCEDQPVSNKRRHGDPSSWEPSRSGRRLKEENEVGGTRDEDTTQGRGRIERGRDDERFRDRHRGRDRDLGGDMRSSGNGKLDERGPISRDHEERYYPRDSYRRRER